MKLKSPPRMSGELCECLRCFLISESCGGIKDVSFAKCVNNIEKENPCIRSFTCIVYDRSRSISEILNEGFYMIKSDLSVFSIKDRFVSCIRSNVFSDIFASEIQYMS